MSGKYLCMLCRTQRQTPHLLEVGLIRIRNDIKLQTRGDITSTEVEFGMTIIMSGKTRPSILFSNFRKFTEDNSVMERDSSRNFFSAGLDKLCFHRRIKQKHTSRVVFNNVALEETSEHDIPPQKFYKTNVIKVSNCSTVIKIF